MPINITRVTTLFTDNDTDGQKDPGDKILTTIEIQNLTAGTLNGLQVLDNFSGSTIDTIKVTPIAFDDNLGTIVGNTPMTFNLTQLLANDVDPDGPEASLTVGAVTNLSHVTYSTNGTTFQLVPETGYQGTASFDYTIMDAQGLNSVSTGHVTLTITGQVWYVDNTYSGVNGASDGSYLKPFTDTVKLDGNTGDGTTNDDVDASGDTIFMYHNGAAYTHGITLETNQILYGDQHSLSVNGHNIGGLDRTNGNVDSVTTNSVIDNSGANGGITLSTGNTIAGITVNSTTAGAIGMQDVAGGVGTLTISNTSLTGTGKAIDITNGGALNVSLDQLSSGGSATVGAHLQGVTGTFSATTGIIQNSTGSGFVIGAAGGGTASSGGSAAIGYGGDITNPGGSLVEIQDTTGGTITFSGVLTDGAVAAGTTGILIGDNAGTVGFGQALVGNAGSLGAGVSITNNTGSVNFSGAGNGLDINTTTGVGFNYSGTGVVNIGGAGNTINTTTGQIVTMSGGTTSSGINFATLHSGTVASGSAISINNLDGAGTFSGGAVDIDGTTGGTADGISIIGGSAATFTFASATIDNTGGDGIELNGANGGVTFTTVDIDGTAGVGVAITGATNGVTITGGTIGSTNDPAGDGLNITNGTGAVSVGASITKSGSTGDVVEITGHNTGTITISGNISATGAVDNGINVHDNTGGTINFSGTAKTLTTGATSGVDLTNNDNTTVNFTNGGLVITTTTGTGFNVSDGSPATHGSVTVQGTGNTITSVGGTALSIVNTDIGANDVTFQSISADGGTRGIVLNTTGAAGGLHVTGTSTTDGTGGTIQNTDTRGIEAISTADLQIANMNLTNANDTTDTVGDDLILTSSNGAIVLNGVTGVALENVNITGTMKDNGITGINVANFTMNNSLIDNGGGGANESGIEFNNLSGTSSITNTTIRYSATNAVDIVNTDKNLNLTVNNVQFSDSQFDTPAAKAANTPGSTLGEGGLQFRNFGSGTANIDVLDSDFWNLRTQAIQIIGQGTSTTNVDITNNNIDSLHGFVGAPVAGGPNIGSGIDINGNDTAHVNFNVIGNGLIRTSGADGVRITSFLGSQVMGRVNNNITQTELIGSGVSVTAQETSHTIVEVKGNTITEGTNVNSPAIALQARFQTARLDATIDGNTTFVNEGALDDIDVIAGSSTAGETTTAVYLDLKNNHVSGVAGVNNILLRLRVSDLDGTTNPLVYLHNFVEGGAGPEDDIVATWNAHANTPTMTTANVNVSLTGTATAPLSGTVQVVSNPLPIMVNPDAAHQTPPDNAPTGGDSGDGGTTAPTPPTDTAPVDPTPPADTDPGDDTGTPPVVDPVLPPAPAADPAILTQAALGALVDAAIQRWADAGASEEQVAAMRGVQVTVTDMMGIHVGSSSPGAIVVDNDGGGYGWFIDATPGEDGEFAGSGTDLTATADGGAAGRVDALTVIMHELGHQIGLGDDYTPADSADLMYGYVNTGERRLPSTGDVAAAGNAPVQGTAFAVTPLTTVGDLPPGKSVDILVTSTVNAFTAGNNVFTNDTTISYNAGTTQSSAPETLTIDSLTLGGTVWADDGTGGGIANDGVINGTEAGIANVSVTLFNDNGTTAGVWDAGDTAVVGAAYNSILTNGSGAYSFAALPAGEYIVRIDQANFNAGGALAVNLLSSAPNATDPDNNVDNDDNGVQSGPGQVTYSLAITLAYNTEPTALVGNDTNNTLDFGFVANIPPTLSVTAALPTYTEPAGLNSSGGGVILLTDATITDPDDTNIESATVAVTDFVSGDVLGYDPAYLLPAGIAAVYNGGTGILTLTGSATKANYELALENVRYSYTGDNPTVSGTDTGRSVSFKVNDGVADSTSSNATVTLVGVNDEPSITPGATAVVLEDAVGAVLSGVVIADPDAGPTSQNVTVTLSVTHGTLTLLTNVGGGIVAGDISGGANGSTSVTVTATLAKINATFSGSGLTYSPTADFNGNDLLQISTSDNGNSGTGGPLTDSDTKSISITSVNDAPVVINGLTVALNPIAEDTPSATGQTVNALLASHYSDQADNQIPNGGASSPGGFSGVAVISSGSSASGEWQYSTDGGANWNDIGGASLGAAKLFTNTAAFRFNPALDFEGNAASLDVRLIDNSLGFGITNAPQIVDISAAGATGGTSAYSAATVTLTESVTGVNDAPVLNAAASPTLGSQVEDALVPSGAVGVLVSSLVDFAVPGGQVDNVTDPDSGALLGIAVTGVNANGTLYYTVDGTNWLLASGLTSGAALLLNADADTRVYFRPNPDFNGSLADAITFRAWDQTSGSEGLTADTSVNGAGTAFSIATDVASITVTPVNDPAMGTAPATLTLNEDSSAAITGMFISDVDAALNPAGVYEVSLTATGGTLTLATLTGLTFTAGDGTADAAMTFHGTVAAINAALATASYAGGADLNGSYQIVFNVTDTFGGIVATGSGAASNDSDVIAVTINPVNDPVVTHAPSAVAYAEDSVAAVFLLSISDVDTSLAPGGIYEVTLSGTHGRLSVSTVGLTFTAGDGTTDTSMTFHGTLANINTALANATFAADADYNGAFQIILAATDTVGGIVATGSGPATSDSSTINGTLNAVDDIVSDSATTNEDTSVNIFVLANDSFEGTPAITNISVPTHGIAVLNDNGTAADTTDDYIVYTPGPDYEGSDSFTYTVTSGGVTETTSVTVGIAAVADIANDNFDVSINSSGNVLPVMANDTFENPAASITTVGGASHGVATAVDGPDADGILDHVSYTPTAGYIGADSFSYTVTTNGVTETATVNILVQALTLGNLVFRDNNYDGIFNAGDVGVAGVVVSLYADANADDVPDGAALTTTTTGALGLYSFAGLGEGNYIVGIGAPNFASGQPLFQLFPTFAVTDPNTNIDNDSNGLFSGGATLSHHITLAFNTEPTADITQSNRLNINNTLDLGFIDNRPPVIGAGDTSGSVTERTDNAPDENTATLTDSGSIAFTDPDVTNTHTVSATPAAGGYLGTFTPTVTESAGSGTIDWSFSVSDGALDYLAATESLTQTYTVTVSDGFPNGTDSEDVTITLQGTNDVPVISIVPTDSAAAALTETDAGLNAAGTLTVNDADLSDTVTLSVGAVAKSGTTTGLVPSDAQLQAMFAVNGGSLAANPGDTHNISWGFNSGAEAFNYLDEGESLVLTYAVQATDTAGTVGSRDVIVTITGTNDGPSIFVVSPFDSDSASITDGSLPLFLHGTLTTVDPDYSDSVTPSVVAVTGIPALADPASILGMMNVPPGASIAANPGGGAANLNWSFLSSATAFDWLAAGETQQLTYTVRVTDDSGATADHAIVITITGTNEAPIAYSSPPSTAVVELVDNAPGENATVLSQSGAVHFSDTDLSDTHSASFAPGAGGYLGSFTLGAVDNGADTVSWTFSVNDSALETLGAGQVLHQSYVVTVNDGHGGTVNTTIGVDLIGSNDAAILSSANVLRIQGTSPVTANGTLTITDVDGPALFQTLSGVHGSYGTLNLSAAGDWSYLADSAFLGLAPGQVLTDTFIVHAADGTPTTIAVSIAGSDDVAIARMDNFTTDEAHAIGAGLNLFNNNGSGADNDPDSGLAIARVNDDPSKVGVQMQLVSGALITVNANGTFSYNPNHAFDYLTLAPGSMNQFAYDSFTYGLAGGSTATVLIKVNGLDSSSDVLQGSISDNVITGTPNPDTFMLQQGGHDTAYGLGSNDGFYFGNAFDSGDTVDGGTGVDTLALQGNTDVDLGNITNVEVILALSGSDTRFGDTANNRYDYDLATNDGNVAAGQTLTVQATGLLPGEDMHFDGSAETDGNFRIFAGQGVDSLIGGAGNDGFFFGADGNLTGADHVEGGAGTDTLALRGNYVGGNAVVFQNGSFSGIEVLALLSGHTNEFSGQLASNGFDYDVTSADGNVAAGQSLDVNAVRLSADESVRFDGRAETDGSFRILSGAGDDTLWGGAGNDTIYGAMGADRLIGGAGADTYVYRFAAESTSTGYDTIVGFDWHADHIDAPGGTRALSQSGSGALSTASFDADLSAGLNGILGAGQAALFTANSGTLSGHVFAVIDTNGVAGYQAGQDLVIELVNAVLPIDPTAGVIV